VAVDVHTTLVASTPKLMLNAQSDDFGGLVLRRCGCPPVRWRAHRLSARRAGGRRGLPVTHLAVNPRSAVVQEQAVVSDGCDFLNAVNGNGTHGKRWREASTLRVRCEEPYTTSASKVLALHRIKPKSERAAPCPGDLSHA